MKPLAVVDHLTVRLIEASDDEAPTSELLDHGIATGKVIDGAVLEAALAWNDCFVLLLTDDIPFEDSLHIHLLNAKFQALDSASLSSTYATGSFSALRLTSPDRVSFRFFGDTEWTIELLPQPKARVPFFSEPAGVKRPLGLSRRFVIHGVPKAARA